jgi:hypothetical protein
MSKLPFSLDHDIPEPALKFEFARADMVGSRVTCSPPPTETDIDYLAQVRDLDLASQYLSNNGYEQDTGEVVKGTEYEGIKDQFRSFRRGKVNIIITADERFYDLFMVATALAKRFNLLEKNDRIALFQGVLYGKPTNQKG